MLAGRRFPAQQREAEAVACYHLLHSGADYYEDVRAAHSAAGLLQSYRAGGSSDDEAFAFPSLTPWKVGGRGASGEGLLLPPPPPAHAAPPPHTPARPRQDAELVVHGTHMASPAFQLLFFAALRALIDELGVCTFNAAICEISLETWGSSAPATSHRPPLVIGRLVSRGRLESKASDFGGLEVFAGSSIGHTDPFRVAEALAAVLQRVA